MLFFQRGILLLLLDWLHYPKQHSLFKMFMWRRAHVGTKVPTCVPHLDPIRGPMSKVFCALFFIGSIIFVANYLAIFVWFVWHLFEDQINLNEDLNLSLNLKQIIYFVKDFCGTNINYYSGRDQIKYPRRKIPKWYCYLRRFSPHVYGCALGLNLYARFFLVFVCCLLYTTLLPNSYHKAW